jgi:predicted metal-binding membrane protein
MASLQSNEPQTVLTYPARGRWPLPTYELAVSGVVLLAALALAWLYMVRQAPGMGDHAGTMGLGVFAFGVMWAVMVVAMMFPTVIPTGMQVARREATAADGTVAATGRWWRLERAAAFSLSYWAVWVAFGLAIYGVLTGAAAIIKVPVQDQKWVAAAVYAVAAAYQFTPAKRACRERCQSPRCASAIASSGPSRWSVIPEAVDHALTCIGCCWAFMAVLIAVGLMNLVAMAILTVVIFIERHLVHRALISYAAGTLLLIAAVLTPFFGWLHPGLGVGAGMHMPMNM